MKIKTLSISLIILLFTGSLFATIRKVDGVSYKSFYDAYQAAGTGDTIYVYAGKTLGGPEWPYNSNTQSYYISISKKIILFGKGNWLDSTSTPKGNGGLQFVKETASFLGDLVFLAGSDGSVVTGFDGGGFNVSITASNITVKRNFNLTVNLNDLDVSNLSVEGNYRVSFSGNSNIDNKYAGFIIKNNFIYQLALPLKTYNGVISNNTMAYDHSGADNGGDIVMSYVRLNGNFPFNAFYSDSYLQLRGGSWVFENNLLIFYRSPVPSETAFVILGGENSFFNYNVALTSTNFTVWPGQATGNIFVNPANVNNIFEAFPIISSSTADSRYRLKAGSPAKQSSRPGSPTDAGMFGGSKPYQLSTIPSIPTIYKIFSPQGNTPSGATMQINISTRSNN